ncbi:hypothetical protein POTOM_031416 [Populus tomentosa]|uniref:Chorismate mutase n=1 Tax=Populus tomentosa TaxID=118781 RepID=A0A8X7Z7P5_POPTO|nr:hypothetical protein POTOM_031416 [Populus tomentosa]
MYFRDHLSGLVKAGDDGDSGSSMVCDMVCLQSHCHPFLSSFGPWFLRDRAQLMALLTYEAVEAAVKNRVEMKTRNYGQAVRVTQRDDRADSLHKVEPSLVANLYCNWTMPLTKEVQVEYLLRRLD